MDSLEDEIRKSVAQRVMDLVEELERIGLRRDLVIDGLVQGVEKLRADQPSRE